MTKQHKNTQYAYVSQNMNIICVICLLFLKNVNYVNNSKFETPFKYDRSYFKQIKLLCDYRDKICRSNDTLVCAVRLTENQTFIYKNFNNSCYLFFTNMCEYPGREFNIINIGSCAEKPSRRLIIPWNKTITNFVKINTSTSAKPALRTGTTKPSTLYDIDTAFDYHICPLSCPDVYSPVCVGVNRGFGMYFKFYTFINHCAGDVYYCKNWREFSPPPDEDEKVQSSPLSWSYCAANRYIQFARFAEMTSAMGHYGWLAGDYRPSRILSPSERDPENGK